MGAKKKKQKTIIVALIRNEEGKILLQKRADPLIPDADGKWEFPGGVVEFGELPEEAVLRECQEEIGCTIKVIRLLPYLHTRIWERTDGETVQAFVSCFEARLRDGIPRPSDKKVSEVGWYEKEEVMELDTLPGIKEFVELMKLR